MTKGKCGAAFILVGLLLIGAALWLLHSNREEEAQAGIYVEEIIPQVVEVIAQRQERQESLPAETLPHFIQEEEPDPNRPMPVTNIDGYDYIGYLSIPALELDLPIMSGWSYPQLQIAPCRYSGSIYLDNLVLMAHNYGKHFGTIAQLHSGDRVVFTDLDGQTVEYEVVALDFLHPTAIEEMTAGEYDLTLFTCTYGGQSRVTVRCDRTE